MAAADSPALVQVTADNVGKLGFFCMMSKKKAEGYQRKLAWLKRRFADGLQIKMLQLPARGFIEYVPADQAWRPVVADGYMFIHCLWVVGRSRGNGWARMLVEECERDARKAGMKGVAMVASSRPWLVDGGFMERMGYQTVDEAPPSFALMVKTFKQGPAPRFMPGLADRPRHHAKGLTVLHTDQCPYVVDATQAVLTAAEKHGLKGRVIRLESCQQLKQEAPAAYGTYAVVLDGQLLSCHHEVEQDLLGRLATRAK